MQDLVEYIAVLEDELDTWATIAQQRDVPSTFLAKLDRLAVQRAVLRAKLAAQIDAFRRDNPREAKHGELA